jgi:membrane protease YdiL (CAAX protease family)
VTPEQNNSNPDFPKWGLPFALALFFLNTFSSSIQSYLLSSAFKLTNSLPSEWFISFYRLWGPVITDFIVLIVIYFAITRLYRDPFRAAIGWSWTDRLQNVFNSGLSPRAASCLAGLCLVIVSGILSTLIPGPRVTLDSGFDISPLSMIGWMMAGVLTAPLVEEIVFRGVLYSALLKKTGENLRGKAYAVAGTSALFLVIHIRVYQSPEGVPHMGRLAGIAVAGIGFTLMRAYSRRLLPSYVMHLVFNIFGLMGAILQQLQRL